MTIFIAGLLAMNTVMTASAVGLFGVQFAAAALSVTAPTAIYSLAVGAFFLFGSLGLPPPHGMRRWAGHLGVGMVILGS